MNWPCGCNNGIISAFKENTHLIYAFKCYCKFGNWVRESSLPVWSNPTIGFVLAYTHNDLLNDIKNVEINRAKISRSGGNFLKGLDQSEIAKESEFIQKSEPPGTRVCDMPFDDECPF